jgi:hypothetical protein
MYGPAYLHRTIAQTSRILLALLQPNPTRHHVCDPTGSGEPILSYCRLHDTGAY